MAKIHKTKTRSMDAKDESAQEKIERLEMNVSMLTDGYFQLVNAKKDLAKEKKWSDTIFQSVPNIIIGLGEKSKILLVNKFAEDFTGYKAEEVMGKSWIGIFIPKELRQGINGVWDKIVKHKSIEHHYINSIITKKGEEKFISWNNTVLTENGKFKMVLSVGEDVTERKKNEEQILNDLSLISATLESTADAILVVDRNGKWVNFNNNFIRMWNIPKNIIKSKNDKSALDHALLQLKDPKSFIKKVNYLYSHPEKESFDSFEFKDGRIFERFSKPQMLGNKIVGRVWSFRDVSERVIAEKKLSRNEKRLREAQKMAHLGYWSWNIKTGDVEWSEEIYKIFGLDPKKFTPKIKSILALSPWPEDSRRDKELIERVIKSHSPGSYEQKFLRPDKSIGYYSSTFQGKYDKNGKVVSIVGAAMDITERVEAKNKIQESEEKFRTLFSNMHSAFALHQIVVDKKGKPIDYIFLDANNSFEKFTGLKKKNIIGKKVSKVLSKVKDESYYWVAKYGKVAQTGKPIDFEDYSAELKKWYHIYCYSPKKGYFATIFNDVTEVKKTEEATQLLLQNSMGQVGQEFFDNITRDLAKFFGVECVLISQLTENNVVKALSMNVDGKLVLDYSYNLSGTLCEDVSKKGFCNYPTGVTKLFPKDKVLLDLKAEGYAGVSLKNRDGKTIGVLCTISRKEFVPTKREQDIMLIIASRIASEIERRKSEEAMRKSEAEYKQLVEMSFDGYVATTMDEKLLDCNSTFSKMTGYSTKELKEKAFYQITPKKWHKWEKEIILNKVIKEGKSGLYQKEYIRKNGTIFPVELNRYLIKSQTGEPEKMIAFTRDITERVEYEKAIRDAEAKYRDIVENSPEMIHSINENGNVVFANNKEYELLGYDPGELIGLHMSKLYSPELVNEVEKGLDDLKKEGSIYIPSSQMIKKNGEPIDVEIHSIAIYDKNQNGKGKFIRTRSIARDITKEKKTQIEISKMQLGFDRSDQIMFMTDIDGRINYINPAFERVYGYKKHEILGKTPRILKSGKQNKEFYNNLWGNLLNKNSINIEVINKTKSGNLITIKASVNPIISEYGKIIGFLAIQSDITEQKKAEQELKRKVEQMEFIGRVNLKRHKKMIMAEREIEKLKAEIVRLKNI